MQETMRRGPESAAPEIIDQPELDRADAIRQSRHGGDLSDHEADRADIAGDIDRTPEELAAEERLNKNAPLDDWLRKIFKQK
ncbi:MAG: hypothetical protein WCT16_00750 [Candidatus Buchananbacteria bacterium]